MLKGINLRWPREVICLIGASGKSTLLRCLNLLEPSTRADQHPGHQVTGTTSRTWSGARSASSSSLQPVPAHDVERNVTLAPMKALRLSARRGRGAGGGAAEPVRPGGKAGRLSGPAVRRTAAAGRDRPGAGHAAAAHAAGRGDQRARPGARGRGARRDQGTGRGRDDDADRHPRDGVRPGHRQPGLLPGGRADRRGRRRPRSCSPSRRTNGPRRFLRRIIDAGRLSRLPETQETHRERINV